jgi:hypothetical protein
MLTDDELDAALRRADPIDGTHVAGPDSEPAKTLLEQFHRRPRRRRAVILGTGLAVGVAGGLTGVALSVGNGTALDTTAVDCQFSPNHDLHTGLDVGSQDPIEVCRSRWAEFTGRPAPADLVACVDRSAQGSIKIVPGRDPNTCANLGYDPYTGPTPEQVRFAAARQDLSQRLREQDCLSTNELIDLVQSVLYDHDLSGWHAGLGPLPQETFRCAAFGGWLEPSKTFLVTGPDTVPGVVWSG